MNLSCNKVSRLFDIFSKLFFADKCVSLRRHWYLAMVGGQDGHWVREP